ncbi:hypothetical protein CF328_g7409 [Tilletia controversa]|nr:hypothetical protein CF328_g7409 [Tilletia controversa]
MGIAELVAMLGSGTSSLSPSSRQRATGAEAPAHVERARYPPAAPYPVAQHRQPDSSANRDREQGLCYHCHLPGHQKRDCPKLKDAVRVVRNTLVALETGTDEQRDAAIQEVMNRSPPSPTAREQAPDENDVPRVRNARSVRVSGYDSSESEDEEASTRYVRAVDRDKPCSSPMADGPGARHRAVVAHKAAVYIEDARNRFELHVDGGSPLSMITPQALHSIAPFATIHPPEPLKIRGYRGDDYQRTIGVVVLPVSFPAINRAVPVTCQFEFHVVADCTGGWILGVDNMKADGIDARSKKERLELEKRPDAEVKLLQAKEDPTIPAAHLLCAEDTTIGPRTIRLVKVQSVEEDQIVRPWLFIGTEPESGGAQVPWCVVGPDTKAVELRNDADTPLVLKQGDPLGDLVPLDKEFESVGQLQACREGMDEAGRREVDGVLRSVAEVRALRDLQGWSSRYTDVIRVTLTHAEPDGVDVLPEIDIKLPTSLDQSVKASSALSEEQQTQLSRILSSHAVWPTPSRPIGTYEFGEVSLRLKEDHKDWVHSEPPRRTSPAQQSVIDETLAEHDALDISEPSRGSYASGVVLVQQRDKIRFCNDYRPLNKVTIDEYYTMPMTDVVFDRLGKAQYFTVIDLNKGYYQFLLESASRDLTGFVTFRGLRRYKRMPFGLKSAPAWFQRAMDKTLGAARWEYAIAYLDDVVIFSDTFEDHLRHVDNILASLERAGLTVSPSKCYFGYDSVALLGFRVSSLGLMTDEEKTRAVLQFPEPTTAVEARRFFAMAAWYRRFVVNFASRARPINESFLGDAFVWGERERAAFDDIRQAITHAPVLARPNFDKPFVLAVDASKTGLGGVLSQVDDEGRERPVLFLSRQTTAGEKNYAPTHLELMGVWWCVKKLHHYFDGSEVEVKTDHNALKWLWDLKPAEMFETRVQKFKAALAPLEGKVRVSYAKGKDNVVADALSRAPMPDRDHGEHDVEMRFRAIEFDGSRVRSASFEAERIVRAVSALRVGFDELDLWEKGYLADPRWRRIWSKAVERGSTMEISGNEEEAASEDSASSASETGSDKEEGEEEELVIEGGSDEEREQTNAATKESGKDVEEGAAVTVQEVADMPRPTHLLPTPPPIRVLRPRNVMAVHRGTDDSLFFIQDRLLFIQFSDGTVKLCVPRSRLEQLIHEYHHTIRSGHPSAERTAANMSEHLFAHAARHRTRPGLLRMPVEQAASPQTIRRYGADRDP